MNSNNSHLLRDVNAASYFYLTKKNPFLVVIASLFFIYILQHPLNILMSGEELNIRYGFIEWMAAYTFVAVSSAIFMLSVHLGMTGKTIRIEPFRVRLKKPLKNIGFATVLLIFTFFALWSYLMLKLNIGMTIWTDFDALPFRLTGILFYGRLFIQPMVLAYIAINYVDSRLKWGVYLLIVALGAWVSLSSGSRFAGLLFAAPLFFLFRGSTRYLATLLPFLAFIVIATVSRSFYLPMVIGDPGLIEIYANEAHQASTTDNLWILPFSYLVSRSMGIAEVLITLGYGRTTPGFFDSLQVFVSYLFPFISTGKAVSIKNIYGFDDDEFGGFGLDIFSNFWVMFGGEAILYAIGLGLIGWMLGKSYRLFSLGLARFGIIGINILVFVMLFILVFEGRGHLMPSILFTAWLFSRKSTPRKILAVLHLFAPKRRPRETRSLSPV